MFLVSFLTVLLGSAQALWGAQNVREKISCTPHDYGERMRLRLLSTSSAAMLQPFAFEASCRGAGHVSRSIISPVSGKPRT